MKYIHIPLILLLICPITIKAQLFYDKELYPNTKTIKGKYYNGSGGGGYWSNKKIDSKGRICEYESYRKTKLLSKQKYIYNAHNDRLYIISAFDINHPNRTDTICRYQYRYSGNIITYQKVSYSKLDSTVMQLTENLNDSILIYQSNSYYFRPKTNKTDVYEKKYTLVYGNGVLVRLEEFDFNANTKETASYEYFPDGKLKRRIIKREPKPKSEIVYVGGVGSDDISP